MSTMIAKNTQPADKKVRTAYHPPRLTDFGLVNALTRSGIVLDLDDPEAKRLYDGLAPNY